RDGHVTGVQTCALPIFVRNGSGTDKGGRMSSKRQTTMAKLARERKLQEKRERKQEKKRAVAAERAAQLNGGAPLEAGEAEAVERSEERRVGKGCRSRGG